MITGTGSLSLKKQSLDNQTTPAVGFTKLTAAHLCSAGQTSINLNALTTPTQLSSAGFTQPNASTLTSANLLFYRKNLTVVSSLRGTLVDYLSYIVSSNSVITLLYSAAENEILFLTIDYAAQTGIKVVDARPLNATGTLPINTTDFNVGTPFKVGQFITTQIGAVLVFVDGVLQYRNTGNSSTVLDGNYYEVDGGNGLGTIIRFNVADNSNVLNVCVVGNGLLSERPDGSMMAAIENIQGQVNNMSTYVADVTGNSVSTVLGAAPSNQDLKAFGDRVVELEQIAVPATVSNTTGLYAAGAAPGSTSGTAIAAGYVGEVINGTLFDVTHVISGTQYNTGTLVLTPGVWVVYAKVYFLSWGTTHTISEASISTVNATSHIPSQMRDITPGIVGNSRWVSPSPRYFNVSSSTTVYLVSASQGSGTPGSTGAVNSQFYAVRIA